MNATTEPAPPQTRDGLEPSLIRRAVMVQEWRDIVFLHWPYPPAVVQELLPDGVEVDTFAGTAWVGLIPFSMRGLGFPRLAPLPGVGSFPEVNVRTYVRAGSRRGVWFFSLDIDRMLPAVVARVGYRLPYCVGAVRHDRVDDRAETFVARRWPGGGPGTRISAHLGERPVAEEGLARFLTARWGLVSSGIRRRTFAPVDHPAWPLRSVDSVDVDDSLITAAGLPAPIGEPHALWSPGVPVRVGRPRRIDAPPSTHPFVP